MKPEEIKRLAAKSENDAVEFKRARGGVSADFWPSYSSFANTDGGVIILAVREKDGKREIEGLVDTEKIVADLWNAVNNPDKVSANVLFNESIYPVDVDGKAVVVVEVPRAERTVRPVFIGSDVFKGTYRRNGEGDYHCSLVRIGERSGMGLSSLYGVWEKEKFAEPSIVESYEPDRTKVMVEFETDDTELGAKTSEVGVETAELGVKKAEVKEKNPELKEKKPEVKEKTTLSEGEKPRSEGVNGDFEVLMGAYRNDFRDNARRVLTAIAEEPEIDTKRLMQLLGISEISVWRAIRAMKAVGLLVREGGDKGGRWIVKK